MTNIRVSWVATLVCLWGAPPVSATDSHVESLEVFRWEKEFLLLHVGAPPGVRARLFQSLQRRILRTPVSVTDRDELFSLYQEARRVLRLQDQPHGPTREDDGPGSLVSDLELLDAEVRKHLGQKSGEAVVTDLVRSFKVAEEPRRTLAAALDALLSLGDGTLGPALDRQARGELYRVLNEWVASWTASVSPETLRRDLELLEAYGRAFPSRDGSARSALSRSILDFTSRLSAASADSAEPLEDRLTLIGQLNPCIDVLRSSAVCPRPGELDRRLKRVLCYGPRFLSRDELTMDFLWPETRSQRTDVREVHAAVLRAVRFPGVQKRGPLGDEEAEDSTRLEVDFEVGDHRPFYLPAGTPVDLAYELRASSEAASASVFREVLVVLNNLSELRSGFEVKPPLPRAIVRGHVYVYDQLGTLDLGYWVPRSCWTRGEMLARLHQQLQFLPLPARQQKLAERLAWLRGVSNLSETAPTLEEATAGAPDSEPDVPGLKETFYLRGVPDEAPPERLAGLFAGEDGLLNRQAGEELPAGPVAELLMRSGHLYGFERGGASGLLGARLRSHPGSTGGSEHLTAICPVVPVKLIERSP